MASFFKFSASEVLAFMKKVVPWLEQSDFVAGYAWFNFWEAFAAGTTSSLYKAGTSEDELTALGRFYASVTTQNPMGNQSIIVS
jgi:Glycosyl hydrolase catalytic core